MFACLLLGGVGESGDPGDSDGADAGVDVHFDAG